MKIYAYSNGSRGAKALRDALGVKLLKHEGRPLRLKGTLINWGASCIDRAIEAKNVLNHPDAVARAVNKLQAFKSFQGRAACPEWTESIVEAFKWLADGFNVVARHKLTGHSGEGIQLLTNSEGGVPEAPLFTKYVKKQDEYRIHVFDGEVFFQQRKARKMDVPDEEVNWQIRNLAGGFIFANQGVETPENAQKEAIKAVEALGLNFGAVDVITTRAGEAYVLEVNTACGLEGTTIAKYVEKFERYK